MKILCEKAVNTDKYAGTIDLLTGYDDFMTDISFDSDWHTYRVDNKIVPSVTQILDDGTYDNPNISKDTLEYARDKGTLVHKEIQEWLEDGIEGFTEEFYEFVRLFNQNKELFEEKAIFDFKTYAIATPKNREKCYKQTSMYADAVEYLINDRPKKLYLVHLPHGKPGRIYDLTEEFEEAPVVAGYTDSGVPIGFPEME